MMRGLNDSPNNSISNDLTDIATLEDVLFVLVWSMVNED
jgi:hypothetical protein